uniref:aspartoacylase n=1 Tax=Myxine glutinosa TaxID=7769 RepID=UPI00358E1888
MLLDMHNTTSNMGISLVLTSSSDHLTLHMAQFLQRKLHPIPCNFLLIEHPTLTYFHVRRVMKHGISIEIGPQPQGVARADITDHMRRSVAYCLDFMHKFNSGMELPASTLDVHRIDRYIDYPRDGDGHITAIIHPAFQDRDWQLLHPGTPIFVSLSGEAIAFEGQETVFPVFINEAAYYEKKIAFWITKRETLNVEPLRVEDGPHKECTST